MKKIFLPQLFVLFFFSIFHLIAQDTVVVQTFTFKDIYKRSGTFLFPPKEDSFRKILMLYTLKCDPLTPHDKYNCGEWDYLTHNLIYTKTGKFDSTKNSFLKYSFGYQQPDTLFYSKLQPVKKVKTFKYTTQIVEKSDEQIFNVAKGGNPLTINGKQVRLQFSFQSSYLRGLGMRSGDINKIQFYSNSVGAVLKDLKIQVQGSPVLKNNGLINSYFKTVFYGDYTITDGGWQDIYFIKPFFWTQFQNLHFDISFVQDEQNAVTFDVENTENGYYSDSPEIYFKFNSQNDYIDCGNITELNNTDKFTLESWVNITKWSNWSTILGKGDRILLQTGNQVGQLYCIVRNPDNTYGQAINAITVGDWCHIAMVFDGTKENAKDKLKLYVNGVEINLTYTGLLPEKTQETEASFTISSNVANTSSVFALVDEVKVWNDAISQETINNWLVKDISSNHPNYSKLVAYYKLNDQEGFVAKDEKGKYNGKLIGVPHLEITTPDLHYKYNPNKAVSPKLNIFKGNYQIKVDSMEIFKDYLVENNSIVQYDLKNKAPKVTKIDYYYPAKWIYLYNNIGEVIDSLFNAPTDYVVNQMIEYYSDPFEIKDVTEIGRFITPYGINLDLGPNGFQWVYDVTDYEPLLHDSVEFSAGNLQELIDVKFLFIKGIPPRKVNRIQPIWGPMKSYSYKDMSNDNVLSNTIIDLLPQSKQFKVITRLTGHGHNSNDGNYPHCCEWKPNQHFLQSGSDLVATWMIWQTNDCALNPVYPQGGTWPGAREGWCPADVVKDNNFEVTKFVKNGKLQLDYDITKVPENNLGMGNGNYVACFQLIEYSDLTHDIDAEIYDIEMPSNLDRYSRMNPICSDPIIIVRNNGRDDLTSLEIEYYVQGGFPQKYIWTGKIASMSKSKITLPVPNSDFWLGNGTNKFIVKISKPNGNQDQYTNNDIFISDFKMPDLLQKKSKIELKTNLRGADFSYSLKDLTGKVIFSQQSLNPDQLYIEELDLPNGCYTLEVIDKNNYGLSYWAFPAQGSGYLKITDDNGKNIKVFNPDFGRGVKYSFYLGSYSHIQEPELDNIVNIFPNPANKELNLSLNDYDIPISIVIYDLNGNEMQKHLFDNTINTTFSLSITNLKPGTYFAKIIFSYREITRKFIVE